MFFVLSRAWDKEKITYYLFYSIYENRTLSTFYQYAGRASCMNFVMGLAHLRVSEALWYIGAEGLRFDSSGNSELFICLTLVTIRKTSFSISTELET